jgi:hypothetical protein
MLGRLMDGILVAALVLIAWGIASWGWLAILRSLRRVRTPASAPRQYTGRMLPDGTYESVPVKYDLGGFDIFPWRPLEENRERYEDFLEIRAPNMPDDHRASLMEQFELAYDQAALAVWEKDLEHAEWTDFLRGRPR